jgi:hypothetical protein
LSLEQGERERMDEEISKVFPIFSAIWWIPNNNYHTFEKNIHRALGPEIFLSFVNKFDY